MPDQSASGKHIVITGGTSGVGLETARLMVAAGGDVFIAGSDPEKGKRAERALNETAGADGHATFLGANLASLEEVRGLAETIGQRVDRVDVLINNAGIVTTERHQTEDGFERTFAVNYLAPFALTNALLPLLRASAPSRVLSLTAAVEPIGRLPFKDLQREHHFGGLRAYSQSKKALAMYTVELARRERDSGSGVNANVIDPFLVRTDLTSAKDVPLLFKLARPLMICPARAARWSLALHSTKSCPARPVDTSCSAIEFPVLVAAEAGAVRADSGTHRLISPRARKPRPHDRDLAYRRARVSRTVTADRR
jgi:retinol dehydrogenase-14